MGRSWNNHRCAEQVSLQSPQTYSSDDYWVYERLKQHATRMELVPVCDIPRADALSALSHHRLARYGVEDPEEVLHKVYSRQNIVTELGIRSDRRSIRFLIPRSK